MGQRGQADIPSAKSQLPKHPKLATAKPRAKEKERHSSSKQIHARCAYCNWASPCGSLCSACTIAAFKLPQHAFLFQPPAFPSHQTLFSQPSNFVLGAGKSPIIWVYVSFWREPYSSTGPGRARLGMGQNLNHEGKPQVVHVSIQQGHPFWGDQISTTTAILPGSELPKW